MKIVLTHGRTKVTATNDTAAAWPIVFRVPDHGLGISITREQAAELVGLLRLALNATAAPSPAAPEFGL